MAGPILLYLLVVVGCALAAMPLCRLAFGDVRRVPLVSVGLTVGTPLALLLFSLVARLVPDYRLAVPLTLLLIGALWAWGRSQARRATPMAAGHGAAWDGRADLLLLGVYAVLLGLLVLLRAGWPSIFWEHDYAHVGSEKLFNFSLIQAYLFGQGYPPENLWLAGEPIDYYVLLHALPGLVAWAWRVLTGDPAAGDVLFVFSDASLLLLGSFALSAWSVALLSSGDNGLSRRQSLGIGLGLGIGVLLSVHAKAVGMVLGALLGGADVGWWALEREAVPYTYSQYPFFLLLQGDHHAFQRVFFLQVALYGAMALLLLAPRVHWPRVLLVGTLAAAVQLAHSGSVLLDLVVFGLAAAGLAGLRLWRGERQLARALFANLGATAAVALVVSLPALWRHRSPSITWYWVETGIASPLLGFLSAQAGPLVFFVAACAAGAVSLRFRAAAGTRLLDRRWAWLLVVIAATLIAVGRSGAAVAVSCAALVCMLAPHRSASGEDRTPLVILAAAVFGTWLMPEFVVGDFSHRPVVEWKRWNLAMRFWLEGHYLVPFLAVLAFAPAFPAALADRRYVRALTAAAALVGTLWLTTHAYALVDRRTQTPDVPRSRRDRLSSSATIPCDADIADFLRSCRAGAGSANSAARLSSRRRSRSTMAGRAHRSLLRTAGHVRLERHVWQFTPTVAARPGGRRPGPADRFRRLRAAHDAGLPGGAGPVECRAGARIPRQPGRDPRVLGVPEHACSRRDGREPRPCARWPRGVRGGPGCAVVRLEPRPPTR